ncbi:hypothetical protein K1T71_014757 [Dendrolimus kikuchii]|nr:hypothetical protein K1T71_014757 [Dendrolimus kikuchii]
MEDDIDIEEHDVLDNPRIKDIFPDLSKVKTEIIEEDDVVTLEEYNPHLQVKQEDFNEDHQDCDAACEETNNLIQPIISDTGTGVLNSSKNRDQVVLPCERFDTDYIVNVSIDNDVSICEETQQIAFENAAAGRNMSVINGSGGNCSNSLVQANEKNSVSTNPMLKKLLPFKSCDPPCNKLNSLKHYSQITAGRTNKYTIHGNSCDIIPNKIILGSKIVPEAPEIQEKEYLPAVVVLKNCGQFLKASSCYCVSCKILFPTENSLDAHKISAHSFLVAFSEREADISVESESDSEIGHFSGRASVSRSNSFKRIDTKDKETNRRVKKRKFSDEVQQSNRSVKISTNFDNTVSEEQCFHCNKFFTDYSALIKHMYDEVLSKGFSKVKGTMEAHKKLHSNGVKKEDFCIISVNNVDGASLKAAELDKRMVIKPLETCTKLVLQRRTCGKKDIWMKREIANASRLHLNSMVSKEKNFYAKRTIKKRRTLKVDKDNENEKSECTSETCEIDQSVASDDFGDDDQQDTASDENTREDNFSENETSGSDVEDESINPRPIANLVVSKCVNCKTCIFSKDLDSHICSSDVYQKFCRLCQETFTTNNWNTHNRYHEEYVKINLIIRDFKPKTVKHGKIVDNIESLSPEMSGMNTDVASISGVFDEDTSESLINRTNTSKLKFKKSYSDDEDYKPTSRKRAKVCQKVQTKSESPQNFIDEKCNIYVCAQCDVHFIHKRSCENHSNGRKHVIGILGFEYCRYCKLRFSTRTAGKHQPTCPLKYKSGYIRIYDLQNNTLRTLKHDETEQVLDVNPATGPSDDESTENKAGTPSIDNCEDTNLTNNSNVSNETDITVCTTENSLLNVAESLNESLRYSSQSNMADNKTEFPKILNMTQEVNKKSYNEDIYVTNDSQTTNATCLQDTDNNTAVKNVDLESSNITTKYDENSIRIISEEITNTDAIVVEHNIIESNLNDIPDSESTKDTVYEDSNTESNSAVIPYETKLFSCSVCDVYFLKVECCHAHVTNHTKLDAREYIQCKLCLLQFLVMELHVHIMTHHGDGFKFEEVVIEDFTPNESQPRIYKLRDKLQSLIISTTCTEGE